MRYFIIKLILYTSYLINYTCHYFSIGNIIFLIRSSTQLYFLTRDMKDKIILFFVIGIICIIIYLKFICFLEERYLVSGV